MLDGGRSVDAIDVREPAAVPGLPYSLATHMIPLAELPRHAAEIAAQARPPRVAARHCHQAAGACALRSSLARPRACRDVRSAWPAANRRMVEQIDPTLPAVY